MVILTGLTLVTASLTGCAGNREIILYPMAQTDIFQMKPGNEYTPQKQGWFVSDFWMDKIGQAKVEQVK